MRKHKYYRDVKPGMIEIDMPVASPGRDSPRRPAMLDYGASQLGFRKTRKVHTIAHPVPTRRYLAGLRRAAQNPRRHRQ